MYAKILTVSVTVQCTCLIMYKKHTTVSHAVADHFVIYMLNACSGYVFNAVSLRQFVKKYSSCLHARLKHDICDAEVIFDGHPDDVRTIWQLEYGFLLLHEHDLSSKPHSL